MQKGSLLGEITSDYSVQPLRQHRKYTGDYVLSLKGGGGGLDSSPLHPPSPFVPQAPSGAREHAFAGELLTDPVSREPSALNKSLCLILFFLQSNEPYFSQVLREPNLRKSVFFV